MRILHLTRDFPPRSNGGLSTAVGGLVQACRQSRGTARPETSVISFDAWRPSKRSQVRAEPLPGDRHGVLRIGGVDDQDQIAAFADSFEPTHVHVHDGMLWELGAQLGARHDARTVFTVHIAQWHLSRLRGLDRITASEAGQRLAIASCDTLVAPSQSTASLIEADFEGVRGRLVVAGLGIMDSEAARQVAMAERPDAAPLLFVGRFGDVKGIAELLDAIGIVLVHRPTARFVLAGGLPENPRSDRRWRARIRARFDRAQVELPGWLDAEALRDAYREAAGIVCPSWHETFGQSALEGMLHGLPVIASKVGALADLVDEDRTGLLTRPRDPVALAAAMLRLVENPVAARQMGAAAADLARERWLWRHVLPAHLAAWRR